MIGKTSFSNSEPALFYVRYALACRDATNQALKSAILRNSGLDWLRHDKLKFVGHIYFILDNFLIQGVNSDR